MLHGGFYKTAGGEEVYGVYSSPYDEDGEGVGTEGDFDDYDSPEIDYT